MLERVNDALEAGAARPGAARPVGVTKLYPRCLLGVVHGNVAIVRRTHARTHACKCRQVAVCVCMALVGHSTTQHNTTSVSIESTCRLCC